MLMPIKKQVLLLACILLASTLQAQLLKKVKDKVRHLAGAPVDTALTEGPYETERSGPVSKGPSLVIGGDEQVQIDSIFEFDIAVYQESEAWEGSQRMEKGGEEMMIYYSSARPQLGVHLVSKSTGARYRFYADFLKGAQLSITAIHQVGAGTREKLNLQTMEPVYPGETGYLNRLIRTGEKKVIAGIACEEYTADTIRRDSASIGVTSRVLTAASIWVPQEPHTLFPGYVFIPDHYKDQIEQLLRVGSYPPVVLPLEMHLEYSNGDKVNTWTTDIVRGESRMVAVSEVIQ